MTGTPRTYDGWWDVPDGMLTATGLRELDFPRQPTPRPHAYVKAEDWRGKKDTHVLYRAVDCPPTAASAAHLAAAANRSTRPRSCADCPARSQRPLPDDVGGRPLCQACRSVILLRTAQDKARQLQATTAAEVAEVLAWPDAAIVQVDLTVPPPTPGGNPRKPTAARIRACQASDGARLIDVFASLTSERARIREPYAAPPAEAAPIIHAALIGRPLLCWDAAEITALREAAPHPRWPQLTRYGDRPRAWTAHNASTWWRAQLNDRRQHVRSLPPGTPDRLLLHLQRIAATATVDGGTGDPGGDGTAGGTRST